MNSLQTYLLYYFIIISTSMIFSLSAKTEKGEFRKFNKPIFWSALLLPVLISGFRYGVGVDYFNYERIYYRLTSNINLLDDFSNTRYEPSWIILNYLVKLIFDDVKYVFIISSLLIWLFHFKAIYDHRKSINISIAVVILLCTLYNPSFNIIRLSVAASIIMLSVKPILERRKWRFFVTVLFAASFHFTSLVFLPAYWITNSKKANIAFAKKTIAIISTVCLVIFAIPIVSFVTSFDVFSTYSHYEITYGDIGIGMVIIKLPILLLILLNTKKLKNNNNAFYLITVLFIIGVILKFFGYLADYIGRIATYYEMMQVLIVSAIIHVQKNKYEKLLYTLVVLLYFIGWYTFEIIINNGHKTIPYIWN